MDPVEVMVSVQSRTKIMQVMRIVQSWAMPGILSGLKVDSYEVPGGFDGSPWA